MAVMNNGSVQDQDFNQKDIDTFKYLAMLIRKIRYAVSDNDFSIEKYYDFINNVYENLPFSDRGYEKSDLQENFELVKKSFDDVLLNEDKRFWNVIKQITSKYNITETNMLADKINELLNDTAALESIASKINSIYPNRIVNTKSVIQFIDDTLQEDAAVKQVNQTFTNVNDLIKQNVLMKQQLDQLRSQILAAGGNPAV